eukprot:CAMPEP_0201506712 /NCGR_PEP_ID=MMETSP0161_2-20130828/583_1 /ASSEMBLY_ACC=CAM_ASM_000251 /TAXON_ID=180227 /ORGANISM="Neoparamoeba aestuarina, Strain SoJaBio B1-5/56/2" /LENGTH=213 /DNA_ID=CAMNT_0047900885 /DNA_START=117 /DNA_END=758 /DNA_ORIENTATION=+
MQNIEADWRNAEHSMGTSIMAVEFDGGVVVAADSRTSTGQYVSNRVSDKLTHVHDRILCCRSGSAADTQYVADVVKFYLELHCLELSERPSVKTAATLFKQLCYENKNYLTAGIIVGGWDPVEGGSVYSIPLGGACVRQPFAIGGSGSTYIYGYCDAHYKKGMSKEECLAFCRNALSLAMARDGSSGGVIRSAVITESGVEREMISGDQLPFK